MVAPQGGDTMSESIKLFLVAVLALTPAAVLVDTLAFVNGQWFDGESFVAQRIYSMDGTLSFSEPKYVDQRIDLRGSFVIPPFGEAHNHDLTSDWEIQGRINEYLWDGVYYAKMQSAFSIETQNLAGIVNIPASVDVSFTYAPVTGPAGHPIRLREVFFDRGYYDDIFPSKEAIAGIGYTMIRDRADLDAKWPGLIKQKPDFIKFMLSYSEEYALRRDDPEFFGKKGLDPGLAPLLVEKAHRAGKRITAHVNTAADFHFALVAGVDEIAHMPGIAQPEVVRVEDARLAARTGTVVITTLMLTTNIADDYPAWYQHVMDQHKANLIRLKEAGAVIAIGSDFPYRDTSLNEALLVHQLGVFSNLELLKMWTENSPATIFPGRKIGRLANGYEASFLVLGSNPLEDFEAVRDIRLRYKQGRLLELTRPEASEEE